MENVAEWIVLFVFFFLVIEMLLISTNIKVTMMKSTLKVFVDQITNINNGKEDRKNELKTPDEMEVKKSKNCTTVKRNSKEFQNYSLEVLQENKQQHLKKTPQLKIGSWFKDNLRVSHKVVEIFKVVKECFKLIYNTTFSERLKVWCLKYFLY